MILLRRRGPKRQGGAVLLVTTLILVLGSAYLLIIDLNANARRTANYEQSRLALNEAKQALISYAATYYEDNPGNFGVLPCPDMDETFEEGNQHPTCGDRYKSALGKLPWQTLGLTPLKDAYGSCLWYAVSGAFKGGSTRSLMINDDTLGTFQVLDTEGNIIAGATPSERPVAIVFAPGRSINGQTRLDIDGAQCEGNEAINYQASNYLEGAPDPLNPPIIVNNFDVDTLNPDVIDQFMIADDPESEVFNDLVTFITADELFNAIKQRSDYPLKLYDEASMDNLTYRLAECIAGFAQHNADNHDDDGDGDLNRSLPWPTSFDLVDYRDDAEYDDVVAGSLIGRLPMLVKDSNDEVYNGCGSPHTCARPDDDLRVFCKTFWTTDSSDLLTTAEADELLALWANWKDHLFYVVSEEYEPQSMDSDTDACLDITESPALIEDRCITINVLYPTYPPNDESLDKSMMAGLIFFSGEPLASLAQSRLAPPIDGDDKQFRNNYLEDRNVIPYTTADVGIDTEFSTGPVSNTFNDIAYCINEDTDDTGIGGPVPFAAGRCPFP